MMELASKTPWRIGIGLMLMAGFIVWPLALGEGGTKAATTSTLRVSPESHDFGAVTRLGGEVQTTFAVRNRGDTPLQIRRIWTS